MRLRNLLTLGAACAALVAVDSTAHASSHREAPFISKNPKTDASDFYVFRSYEAARIGASATDGYVTMIANYEPLQDPAGGPNFYPLDPDALYEIMIDNNGDGVEDLTFQFRFSNTLTSGAGGAATGLSLPIPYPDGDGGTNEAGTTSQTIAIPLINDGNPASNYTNGVFSNAAAGTLTQSSFESYTLTMVNGDRRTGTATPLTDATGSGTTFYKPVDNIGTKSFGSQAAYEAYAKTFIRNVGSIPNCTSTLPPRVFVGQRHESFAVNLGTVFDLVNASPTVITAGYKNPGPADMAVGNIFNTKNVTSIALEIPASCLLAANDVDAGAVAGAGPQAATTIGAWTTASVRQARVINPTGSFASPTVEGGAWAQISRLSNPLVNELVIGLKDKDKFNTSAPKDDGTNFAPYVTNPTLAALLEILFGAEGAVAPKYFPRTDLMYAFLSGVPGVNENVAFDPTGKTANGTLSEMLRLNTALPATPYATQLAAQTGATAESLGAAFCFKTVAANTTPGALKTLDTTLAGCDPAGFPNGRRPGDDVVDIELRVMMGYLFNNTADAPAGAVGFTDAVHQSVDQFVEADATLPAFPYLTTPISGAPGGLN
jgi:hypothetical protein